MKNTEAIILDRALELFNEKGVEYGGMRELAGILNMRVSNITYYFATKDDLIAAIAARLAEANGAIIQQHAPDSVKKLLEMYSIFFHNQYKYRCLLVSFVHLFNHHPGVAEQYKGTEKKRRQSLENILKRIQSKGYLKKVMDPTHIKLVIAHISLVSRFWISEARISYPDKDIEEVIKHYLLVLSEVFQPYVTIKGKKDIAEFCKAIQVL